LDPRSVKVTFFIFTADFKLVMLPMQGCDLEDGYFLFTMHYELLRAVPHAVSDRQA